MFNEFLKNLFTTKNRLLFVNIILVSSLIILKNLNILPFRSVGNFIFLAFLVALFSLYRPGWGFLFLTGVIALENINLAPVNWSFNLRPYQILTLFLTFSIFFRYLLKRLNFKLPKLSWIDLAVFVFVATTLINFPSDGLKWTLITLGFAFLFYLTRTFVQNINDLKQILPLFLSSGMAVIFYGIWQNWSFLRGKINYEVMPGRPNAVFAEPDWLGLYLVILAAAVYSLMLGNAEKKYLISLKKFFLNPKNAFHYLYLFFISLLLLITVSRSAWIAFAAVTLIYLSGVFLQTSDRLIFKAKRLLLESFVLIVVFSLSLIYAIATPLTSFEIFFRMKSAASGMQKITVSCQSQIALPKNIANLGELETYECRHINLEDIEKEKAEGKFVSYVYRQDPNVAQRIEIYKKSLKVIKDHPVQGIGWSKISEYLGKDERGQSLNSSNIFMEVWLGSGLVGMSAFVFIWFSIIFKALKKYLETLKENKGLQNSVALFIIMAWSGITVANLFNAGIFLGIIWFFAGLSFLSYENRD